MKKRIFFGFLALIVLIAFANLNSSINQKQTTQGSLSLSSDKLKNEGGDQSKAKGNSKNKISIAPASAYKSARIPQGAPTGRAFYSSMEELITDFGMGWSSSSSTSTSNQNSKTKVRSILVSNTEGPVLDEQNITDFVEKLRPLFGAPNANLTLVKANEIPHQYDLEQTFNGYTVYGGRVRVITHPEESTPVIINNELKPVATLNQDITFSANAAEDIILKEIMSPALPTKLSADANPLVFYTTETLGVLSWLVHAQWFKDQRAHSSDFLVSASTGKILFERDLVYY